MKGVYILMEIIKSDRNPRRVLSGNILQKKKLIKQNIPLYIMLVPIIALYIIFRYLPMFGLISAFQDFNLADGFFKSPWVGLKHFKFIFTSDNTKTIIFNTLKLGILTVIVGFPFPILLALMMNEARKKWFKQSIQTLVYLPHFMSWVIVGGIVITVFSQETGIVNRIYSSVTGAEPFPFLYREGYWMLIFLFAGVWKEAGFSAIIFLAALASIDPGLYEAAAMDGATKFKQIRHITLPGISSTIILMLILAIGRASDVGFDPVYILQNPAVNSVADVISTYVYRMGLLNGFFSMPAALGLFQSVLNFALLITANTIARKFNQGLW